VEVTAVEVTAVEVTAEVAITNLLG